ncbi:hypothetical protein QWY22_15320 [Planococcus liqunii]|uniref:Uncharacterized protein n=1 Tax=Planococcus liqunii TaxID=3058394 RepID=A0ABT8MNK6_9BACL|nr:MULTISPECIES: hypothetical protein [unclassified Planococcus (in: firmicutes)]MDN7226477.1 hypothetical protein [Planococcus sp. N064]WKA50257.1 hypothetical protein QWY22_15320 [Planococcus sp. N056]
MIKKIAFGIGALVLVLALALGAFVLIKDEVLFYKNSNLALTLKKPALLSFSEIETTEKTIENAVDQTYFAHLKLFGLTMGTYEITERTLGNGTEFVFEQLSNASWLPIPVSSELSGLKNGELTDWNPEVINHPYHNDFGVDPTVNPFGAISYADGEVLQGNVYISESLETAYDGQQVSRLKELHKEVRELELTEDTLQKNFWLMPNRTAESWVLLTQSPLFTNEEIEQEWIEFALNNQTMQLNWLTAEGPFTKLPFSIEPGTKMGYGRAMGRFEDEVALQWNERSPSLFFESMVLNSRVNLLNYLDEFEGTRWPTEYTSMWLKNAYGLKAPYVDTRFNEYVAFYLDNTAEQYPDDIDQEQFAVVVYADYLLSRIEKNEIIQAEDGFLIVDYFDEDPETPLTHASLNHELGGLKILLTAYERTNDSKYLDAATQVVKGIEQFGQNEGGWIRENGDLWYQARPDGTFSGDDYPQLTLVDLLETQALFEELEMERNPYFDELIESKLKYLDAEGIELIEKVTNLM